jgi:hypothetical protein
VQNTKLLVAYAIALWALVASRAALAAPLETIPVEKIRPGMTGYGLTVFSGFKVERFKVQVIDVIKNFLPEQDLILIRADHPVLRHTGVVGGMSGSPIYIDNKLSGALAYGWRFTKDAICGVTPIKNMLELLKLKPRGMGKWNDPVARRGPADRATLAALARRDRWWRLTFAALGGRSATPAPPPSTALAPAMVPLSVAGFSPEVVGELRQALRGYGFEPVQGGGTGAADSPTRFELGGSLGVQLVRGDMSMAATGTVTHIDRDRVLGFGHRMFNAGEIHIQAIAARINHTLANISRSFKISSPGRVLGALVQDRQAGVMISTSERVGTVPMTVTVRSGGQKRVFKVDIARHRLLTGTLASTVLMSSLSQIISDVDQATFKLVTRFGVRGHKPVRIEDHLYSPGGIGLTAAIFSRGLRGLREVMSSDFEPAFVERLDLELDVTFGNDVVEIVAVGLSSQVVDPGSRVNVMVTFRPYAGSDYTKTYPIEIPATMAGTVLQLEVASGPYAPPDRAPPENMRQLLESLQEGYPARSVVLTLGLPLEGMKLRGHVLRDLPGSVADSLAMATLQRGEQTFQSSVKRVHGTQKIIVGRKLIRIRVRSEVNK